MPRVLVGCAGWSIPRSAAGYLSVAGSHLGRYASLFPVVEINSSFYRPHRRNTYVGWAASVPAEFRFTVKMPKQITHELRLNLTAGVLDKFLGEVAGLGEKLGCLLLQLPPSLRFDAEVAEGFLAELRRQTSVLVACEPRHATWFSAAADELLRQHQVARVAADPACVPDAALPEGWNRAAYYRLHGSPRTYYSSYDSEYLSDLAKRLRRSQADQTWCIFDNTALGAATENARELLLRVEA